MLKQGTIILLLLFCCSAVWGAMIHGEIYEWSSLEKLTDVVLDINSTPKQVIVSKDGSYSFSVPQGGYRIHAEFLKGNRIALVADENINVQSEGEFILDLIMFPPLDASALEEEFDLDLNFDVNEETFREEEPERYPLELIGLILIVTIILAVLTYYLYSKPSEAERKLKKKKKAKKEELPKITKQLDKYALEVIEALKRSGNRLTQKELREKVSVGEAKVSLIVSELEELGLVKKIKRGRGNIIILKPGKIK